MTGYFYFLTAYVMKGLQKKCLLIFVRESNNFKVTEFEKDNCATLPN